MILMAERDNFVCVLLEEDDYEIFHAARTRCWRDKTTDEVRDLEETLEAVLTEEDSRSYWKNIFMENGMAHFVLFEKRDDGPPVVAGICDVAFAGFKDCGTAYPYFQTLHIMTSHRGRRLADLLYEAHLTYAAEHTDAVEVRQWIKSGNRDAIKVARRNGYIQRNGVFQPHSKTLEFVRSLEDLRPRASSEPIACPVQG